MKGLSALRHPSDALVSHGAWSAVNVLVQLTAYLLLNSVSFALVSLAVLAGSQGGQIARAAALEAGLGSVGVGGRHVKLALVISVLAGLTLTGGVSLALELSAVEGFVVLIAALSVGIYDTVRNIELLSKRYQATRRSDLVWLGVTVVLLAVSALASSSPVPFIVSWACGSLVALGTLRPRELGRLPDEVELSWVRVLTFGGDYLSVAGVTQAFTLAAAATSGVSVIATLRLAQLLLAPINFVITGVRSVLYQSLETTNRDAQRAQRLLWAGLVIGAASALLSMAIQTVLVATVLVLAAQRVAVLAGLFVSGVMRKFGYLSSLRRWRLASVLSVGVGWFVTRGEDAQTLALCLLLGSLVFLLGSGLSMISTNQQREV